jgi:hypothetical protein
MQLPAVSYIEHRQIEHRAALIYAGLPKSNGFVRPPSKTRLGNIVIGFSSRLLVDRALFCIGPLFAFPKAQSTGDRKHDNCDDQPKYNFHCTPPSSRMPTGDFRPHSRIIAQKGLRRHNGRLTIF